jgi:hypothetical protein
LILHPSVLALLVSAAVIAGLLLYAVRDAVRILRHWDLRSGSQAQLGLERRTYLVSTMLAYVLGVEIVSLFLFVYTADSLAPLFTGAMCAAGSLKANAFGYPVLGLKLAGFVLAGIWLIVNHADNQGYDYPLVKPKYALLLLIAPVILADAVAQVLYFANLRPEVITSCCGSLFSATGDGLGRELVALPPRILAVALYSTVAAAVAAGLLFVWRARGAYTLAALSAVALPLGLAAVVSFVSPYVYEMPTHHCPFCLLQKEYGYIGYLLYAALLGASVCGMGAGVVASFRRIESLSGTIPGLQRRLATTALGLYALFVAVVTYRIGVSHLVM